MHGLWLLVLGHYLPTPQSHTFSQLKEDRSEGRLGDMGSIDIAFATDMQMPSQSINLPRAVVLPEGTVHHPVVESDRLMTYTGLVDYDTLFEARLGRGALDHVPRKSEENFLLLWV